MHLQKDSQVPHADIVDIIVYAGVSSTYSSRSYYTSWCANDDVLARLLHKTRQVVASCSTVKALLGLKSCSHFMEHCKIIRSIPGPHLPHLPDYQ